MKSNDASVCFQIVPLAKAEWEGTPIPIRYTTDEYYDVEKEESGAAFSVRMVRRRFDTPVTHTPEEYDFPDKLYQPYWENAEAFGVVSDADGEKKLLACIEVCPEEWSNRLIVTELWVDDSLHRQGIGTRLINIAKAKAAEQNRRAVILETQSCNVRAIDFYRGRGFELIGYDACCYTNTDIARHEVRFNFGCFMHANGQQNMKLVEPSMEYDAQMQGYRQEFLDFGGSMDGCGSLRRFARTEDWLEQVESLKKPETAPPGLVPMTQFIYVREEDKKVVGVIQIRHYFNEYLEKYAGHIGYSVCPSERRKGYATAMLRLVLPKCKALGIDRVLISCVQGNEGSRKTILNNGGVFESTVLLEEKNVYLERYWIDLAE